jgi:hypothetical protein
MIILIDAAYWNQLGQQLLLDELGKQRINSQAKNIIFFLGDGTYHLLNHSLEILIHNLKVICNMKVCQFRP